MKISFRKGYDPSNIPVPKDTMGNPLRIPKRIVANPKTDIDTRRIQIYECLLYDKDRKICKDYENRPDICRTTSCLDDDSQETIDEQHKKKTQIDFIKTEE